MLVFRLMAHCNNRCRFCLAREEMACAEDIPLNVIQTHIDRLSPGSRIDFFGGEPTLYPHFLEALRYARKHGHPCTIATNGRRFADSGFTRSVAQLGIAQIRTSLYGDTAAVHDLHTSAPGSFAQTLEGIRNIIAKDIALHVNIVITAFNLHRLEAIVELLDCLRVTHIKFSSLTNAKDCEEFCPNLSEVDAGLRQAIIRCKGRGIDFTLEKTPLCLVPEFAMACAYEPDPIVFTHVPECDSCVGASLCVGIPREQVARLSDSFPRALNAGDLALESLAEQVLDCEQHEFIRWDDELLPSLTVILKAAATCNLSCDYCYASRNFSSSETMDEAIIEPILNDLATSRYNRIDVNWHGGEPVLAGQKTIHDAMALQAANGMTCGRTVVNRIQTNGTLLSHRWIDMLAEDGVEVGLSLDGPSDVHDTHRKFCDGRGSWARTHEALERLVARGILPSLLSVITHEAAQRPEEIYAFFSGLPGPSRSVDFLPVFEVDCEGRRVSEVSLIPTEFAAFMTRLFDVWFADDDPTFTIPFFTDILKVLMGGQASLCRFRRGCRGFVTIEPNGDVYPCDRFSGLSEFRLGNIRQSRLTEILDQPSAQAIGASFDRLPADCLSCEWVRICRGGCAYEAWATTGHLDRPSWFCGGLKTVFQHVDEALRASLPSYVQYQGSGCAT